MLLNSVIIILREVLEAALIISIFLAFSRTLYFSRRWLAGAFLVGGIGAVFYAAGIDRISSLLDGVGQEVTNAILQFCIYLLLIIFNIAVVFQHTRRRQSGFIPYFSVLVSVTLAIIREGSEIILYIYGFYYAPRQLPAVLIGAAIGSGIGFSIGILFYYALSILSESKRLQVGILLLTLIAAGMISQATQQLIQADFLPSQRPLWDTSSWLAEESAPGQLLYAFIGYEATPTPLQVLLYFFSIGIMALATGFSIWTARKLDKH